MRIKDFFRRLALLLCVLLVHAQTASAQTLTAATEASEPANLQRWYQIEVIAFSRTDSAASQEIWPKNIRLFYPANTVLLKPEDASGSDGFVQLKAGERQLNAQAATIAKAGNYTLLFHQAWRQFISSERASIFISGGKTYSGHQELEGSIELYAGKNLQLQTNLWLTQFVAAHLATATLEDWPELPALPRGDLNSGEMRISEPANGDQPADYVSSRTVKIDQQRNLRAGEVHYIDHPLLGVIVKLVPYDAPAL